MQRGGLRPDPDLPNFRGTVIRHDKKQSFQVDRTMVIRTEQGPGINLLSSRNNAIAPTTKEIIIDFVVGATKVQAILKVKSLEYRGKLDL